ncbi:phosphotransferase family protein [Nocardioides currus]|uniref:Aminoglycoside phosphotransferase domain-containing protein n=1 Tax=Nocardioides currus TaxID=2133958 RepID=A0A2R7YU02_9ACTN|nr:phosphotransferase [Nocardioides currus]PUA79838.1 hypothetical protein C7S10_17385 [Nocardioides currus]
MTEVHHVALLHDGGVLVDETGALPSFVHQDDSPGSSLAVSLRLVGADVLVSPTARLDDGGRVQLVGVRHGDPAGTFVTPDRLADPALAAVVATAVTELDPARTPPGRPAWFRPGWFDEVEAWIDSVLEGSGRRRTHPIEAVKMWSISAVARVRTDAGDLWLKAPCEHFRAEARVHPTVARLFPDLVPSLVAVEEEQGWLLMEPLVGAEDEDRADGAGLEVATVWARTQVDAVAHVDELVAGGCRVRGVEETLAAFHDLLDHSTELPLLTPEELETVRTSGVDAVVREFWAAGIPDTLSHGDLHLGNVAWDGTSLRIFDWTDGCVSHPFLDASHLAHFTRSRPGDQGLEATYAEQWRAAYPDADVDRVLELAPFVDLVFQAVTFDDIASTTEPMSRWELGGVVADLLRTLSTHEALRSD